MDIHITPSCVCMHSVLCSDHLEEQQSEVRKEMANTKSSVTIMMVSTQLPLCCKSRVEGTHAASFADPKRMYEYKAVEV